MRPNAASRGEKSSRIDGGDMPDITIEGPDGGFGAYLAIPASTPAPGIVVAQEIFGVNQVMRDVCDWLAGEGFVACCPDIFWRIEPGIQLTDKTEAEWARAFELFGLFDVDQGIEDMKASLAHLRRHETCTARSGASTPTYTVSTPANARRKSAGPSVSRPPRLSRPTTASTAD